MTRILLTILTTLTINMTAFGQLDFGLKANFGLSRLSTKLTTSQQLTQKFHFVPSGQGGLFYNLHLREKFLIGAELLLIQIEGKEYLEIPSTDINGNLTGEVGTDNIWRHITYFGLPIYFGYNFKKLNVNIGLQTNFTLASSGREKGQVPDGYGGIATWDNKFSKLGIDDLDYGARAGLIFQHTDKFSLEIIYYYGINNILKDEIISKNLNWKWKVQQMTIGLRYKFISFGGEKN